MTTFAAVDAAGHTRFVGDVPRGIACTCFCPTCASPMIARQGDINSWGFAHEALQERPECMVGSLNLLRRLAIEKLAAMQGGLPLPPGDTTVDCYWGGRLFSEAVFLRWPVKAVQATEWNLQAPSSHAVATLELRDSQRACRIGVLVQIAQTPSESHLDGFDGALIFRCPPPSEGRIRTEQDAITYLASEGDLLWLQLPDFAGTLSKAKARVEKQRQSYIDEQEAARVARNQGLVDAQRRMLELSRHRDPPPAPLPAAAPSRQPPPPPANLPAWAYWKRPNSSFFAFGVSPRECWVVMSAVDFDGCYVVPLPLAFEGWDEALPPALARPVPERECYRSNLSINDVNSWFMQRCKAGSRIDSDALVVERFAESLQGKGNT